MVKYFPKEIDGVLLRGKERIKGKFKGIGTQVVDKVIHAQCKNPIANETITQCSGDIYSLETLKLDQFTAKRYAPSGKKQLFKIISRIEPFSDKTIKIERCYRKSEEKTLMHPHIIDAEGEKGGRVYTNKNTRCDVKINDLFYTPTQFKIKYQKPQKVLKIE